MWNVREANLEVKHHIRFRKTFLFCREEKMLTEFEADPGADTGAHVLDEIGL